MFCSEVLYFKRTSKGKLMNYKDRRRDRLRVGGQSIIEYLVLLVVVAIASLIFAAQNLSNHKLNLFAGYMERAKAQMQP